MKAKLYKYLSFDYHNRAYPKLVAQFYNILVDKDTYLLSSINGHPLKITPDYLTKNYYLPSGELDLHHASL